MGLLRVVTDYAEECRLIYRYIVSKRLSRDYELLYRIEFTVRRVAAAA